MLKTTKTKTPKNILGFSKLLKCPYNNILSLESATSKHIKKITISAIVVTIMLLAFYLGASQPQTLRRGNFYKNNNMRHIIRHNLYIYI